MSKNFYVFTGKLNRDACDGDGYGLLGLQSYEEVMLFNGSTYKSTQSNIALVKELNEILYRKQVTVRYMVSEDPITNANDLLNLYSEGFVTHQGAGSCSFSHAYSELTGYLWTDESLEVGGHDLLKELDINVNKYLHLEVEVHR